VLRHFPGSWALRAEILTIVAEQLQFSGLAEEGQCASEEGGVAVSTCTDRKESHDGR
jgi:hypothetical protein